MEQVTKQDLWDGLTILFVFILLLVAGLAFYIDRQHDEEMEAHKKEMMFLEEMNQRIDKREVLDSTYRDHLSKVMYLNKENMYVDNRGYLKTYYVNGQAKAK